MLSLCLSFYVTLHSSFHLTLHRMNARGLVLIFSTGFTFALRRGLQHAFSKCICMYAFALADAPLAHIVVHPTIPATHLKYCDRVTRQTNSTMAAPSTSLNYLRATDARVPPRNMRHVHMCKCPKPNIPFQQIFGRGSHVSIFTFPLLILFLKSASSFNLHNISRMCTSSSLSNYMQGVCIEEGRTKILDARHSMSIQTDMHPFEASFFDQKLGCMHL
jgi:hypothetical protein